MKDWIKEYLDLGWSLCALRPGQKGPYQHRWGHINLDESHWAANPEDGVGLILGRSGVATIDVDDLECAKVALRALGIDLEALLGAPDAVQIVSREGRAKLAYKIPESIRDIVSQKRAINWKAEDGSSFCVLEFRAGSTQLQDVLPPSIHPATGRPYEWRGNFRRMPELPGALAAVWAQWEIARQKMMAADPNRSSHHKASERKQIDYKSHNGSNASVIDTFNRAFTVWDVMSRPSLRGHYEEKGNRWRRIGSTETPGVVALESLSAPGQHVLYSHHAGDDLMADKQYTYTAFSLYCLAEHGGDCGLAVAAAAQELGLPPLDPLVRSAAVGEDQVRALVASGGVVREMRADKTDSASDDDSFGEIIELPPFEIPEEPDPDPETLVETPGCLEGRIMPVPEAQALADWIAGRVGEAKVAATVQTTLAIICHLAGRRYISEHRGIVSGVLFGVLDSATVNLAPYLRCVDDVLDEMGTYDTGSPQGTLRFVVEKSSSDISTSQGLVEHYKMAARLLWGSTSIATMLERESRQINPTFRTMLDRLGEIRHGASLHYSPAKGDAYSVKAPAVTALWALTPHSIGGLVRTSSRSGLFQQTLVADGLAESAIWRTAGRQDLPEAVTAALRGVTSRSAKDGHVYPMDDFQEYEPLRVPVDDDARQAFEQLAREIKGSCETGDKMRDHPLGGASRGWSEAAESIALGLAALRAPRAPRIDLGLAEWACAWVIDCWHLHRERARIASEDAEDVCNLIVEALRRVAQEGATATELKSSVYKFRTMTAKRRAEILEGFEKDGTIIGVRKTSGKRYYLRRFGR